MHFALISNTFLNLLCGGGGLPGPTCLFHFTSLRIWVAVVIVFLVSLLRLHLDIPPISLYPPRQRGASDQEIQNVKISWLWNIPLRITSSAPPPGQQLGPNYVQHRRREESKGRQRRNDLVLVLSFQLSLFPARLASKDDDGNTRRRGDRQSLMYLCILIS